MKHLDLEFRFDTSDNLGTFSGYAIRWNETNRHNEKYLPGSFARSLAEHSVSGTRPVMPYNHNTSDIVGTWETVKEDSKGLFVEGRLLASTQRGADVYEQIKAKAVNGLSIGFRSISDTLDKSGVRILKEIDLLEISIVALPSLNGARISEVRSSGKTNVAAFIKHCQKATRSIQHRTKA